MLTIEPKPWHWDPSVCPADQDFIELLAQLNLGLKVFHMGPGAHHKVGIHLCDLHHVLSITHCPDEMVAYIELIKALPEISSSYQCIFGDVHLLNSYLLPQFDVVSLFHLKELPSVGYQCMSDKEVIDFFWPADIVLYRGSFAFYEIEQLMAGRIYIDYKSLRYYSPDLVKLGVIDGLNI